jgi:hypothetical protein
MVYNFTGGALLRWFRDNFAQKEKEIAERETKTYTTSFTLVFPLIPPTFGFYPISRLPGLPILIPSLAE